MRSKVGWIIVGVIIAFVVGLVAATSLPSLGGNKAQKLAGSGTAWTIPAGSYEVVSFTLSQSATISGDLQATNGVVVYAFNDGGYRTFTQTGSPTTAIWGSGTLTISSFSVSLSSGSWHIVFIPPQSYASTTVVLTNDLVATPS